MATAMTPAPQQRMTPMGDALAHLPRAAIIEYRKGGIIYGEKQTSAGLYLLIEGKVKICRMTNDGHQVAVDIYRTEQFFGESAFVGELEHTEVAKALEDTRLMVWAIDEIQELAVRRPHLGMALFQLQVQRSMEFISRIESFSVDKIARRLARSLIRFSERLGQKAEDDSVQMIPLTHEFLAQYVGTSREIVNCYMVEFRRLGYLRYSRTGIQLYPQAIKDWLRRAPDAAQ